MDGLEAVETGDTVKVHRLEQGEKAPAKSQTTRHCKEGQYEDNEAEKTTQAKNGHEELNVGFHVKRVSVLAD